MLSNQMRGRAIRIDKNNPNKVSNVWHLVTVEPDYVFEDINDAECNASNNKINSCDYDTLTRRFECFVGPCYDVVGVENGIERLSIIKPPFNKEGFDKINNKMIELSKDRSETSFIWKEALSTSTELNTVIEVPNDRKFPSISFYNISISLILMGLEGVILLAIFGNIFKNLKGGSYALLILLGVLSSIVLLTCLFCLLRMVISHISPKNSIKTLSICLLNVLKDLGQINENCQIKVKSYKNKEFVEVMIVNSSVHERNIFNDSFKELLAPIDSPKYVLIKRTLIKKYNYLYSLACPQLIGTKKGFVELLQRKLRFNTGKFETVYTKSDKGRKQLIKCRKRGYIHFNCKEIRKKNKVCEW